MAQFQVSILRCVGIFGLWLAIATAGAMSQSIPRVLHFSGDTGAEIATDGQQSTLRVGERIGDWTLMQVIPAASPRAQQVAVLENFVRMDGSILFIGNSGPVLNLPKLSESTAPEKLSALYLSHTLDEVMHSPTDLLGDEILSRPGDPKYDDVAAIFPPIGRKMTTYSFVGTPETFDKIGFAYGGRTANFDPAPYFPPLAKIRDAGLVRDGLVGDFLPIMRFVYPESEENWTEMIAFAPPRTVNGNDRVQPVWYRVARIEGHNLKWAQYVDSYHPFPPVTSYDSKKFYADMIALDRGWKQKLEPAMKIAVPDQRIANMARFGLIREMMTRVQDFPKYGAVDKDYAGSEHDGFPDTFNVDTTAMLEWGMLAQAGRYIDNYFANFVRPNGALLYRGPETGQYGRMLTVVAQFADYGGDRAVLLRNRKRIDAVAKLLLVLREKARALPKDNPAYGMIAGWSEADASLDPDPPRYMQPYFSNSAEAARGFRDLGRVWQKLGANEKHHSLAAWGKKLQQEAAALESDLQVAISRSILHRDGEDILPAIAGVKEPFHVAVPADQADPQFRSYRAYMEMMYSGILTAEQVKMITQYRSRHHDMILGVPTAYGYNTGVMEGFLAYGHGYGLIQHDMIREAILMTYSDMAHQYTRGTWTAPETRSILPSEGVAPYCTPAQLVVSLMTKWMLVFEDPQSDTLWLGKAAPREWLEDGKNISVEGAPTRWGRVNFAVASHVVAGTIAATVTLPAGFTAAAKLRLRAPNQARIKSVTMNGLPWHDFDAASETITLPRGDAKKLEVVAQY